MSDLQEYVDHVFEAIKACDAIRSSNRDPNYKPQPVAQSFPSTKYRALCKRKLVYEYGEKMGILGSDVAVLAIFPVELESVVDAEFAAWNERTRERGVKVGMVYYYVREIYIGQVWRERNVDVVQGDEHLESRYKMLGTAELIQKFRKSICDI